MKTFRYFMKYQEIWMFIYGFRGQLKWRNIFLIWKFVDSNDVCHKSFCILASLTNNEWSIACGSWLEDASQNVIMNPKTTCVLCISMARLAIQPVSLAVCIAKMEWATVTWILGKLTWESWRTTEVNVWSVSNFIIFVF